MDIQTGLYLDMVNFGIAWYSTIYYITDDNNMLVSGRLVVRISGTVASDFNSLL